MFVVFHPNRNDRPMSMRRLNRGGYMSFSHMVAELRMDRLPNMRYRTDGEALTRESTTPFDSPAGAMAGARAMKTLTWWFNLGWMARVANA